DRDVAREGARHRARAVAHERAAHDAPAPVGTDDDGRPVGAAIRLDAHARTVAGEIDDAFALAQLDAALARRPGERRVELAPPDDRALSAPRRPPPLPAPLSPNRARGGGGDPAASPTFPAPARTAAA